MAMHANNTLCALEDGFTCVHKEAVCASQGGQNW
jgi:hypothetical protein